MAVSSFLAVLERSLVALTLAGGPADSRLRTGDSFSVRINYSNVWNEVSLAVKGPAGQIPIAPQGLMASRIAADRIAASSIGADPLVVDMTIQVRVREPGQFSVTPSVSEVRYFDDRSRKWSVKSATKGSREQAEQIVKDAAGQWRRVFPGSLESEMLEEQLVGAAIFLLSGVTFDASIASWDSDPELPDIENALKQKLPAELPAVLHKSIAWFYREAVARVIARAPEDLREKVGFDARGVPYTVERVRAAKGRATAEIAGQMHWMSTGAYFKESFTVDKGTGLVLESKSITVRDALNGRDARFGAVRWATKLTDFKPATGAAGK